MATKDPVAGRTEVSRERIAKTYRLIRRHVRRTPVIETAGADFALDPFHAVFKLE